MARVRIIDVDTTIRVIVHTARGLVKAHAAGIVHRDLKPENIFLERSRRVGSSPVFVKIRKPDRISFESRESSSDGSVSGFLGNSHAVTMVVREEISGPAIGTGGCIGCSAVRVHDARHTTTAIEGKTREVRFMTALTAARLQHSMLTKARNTWLPISATHDARFFHGSESERRRPA
jgi:serine/threonine protein kinase